MKFAERMSLYLRRIKLLKTIHSIPENTESDHQEEEMIHPESFTPTQTTRQPDFARFQKPVERFEPTQTTDRKCPTCNGFTWLLGLSPAEVCMDCPEGRAEAARRDQQDRWNKYYSDMYLHWDRRKK